MAKTLPIVLTVSGHDPSGGAGIQADIETLCSLGCHPVSVITALTEQDTRNVFGVIPQPPEAIINQIRTLLADMPVAAVKVGLLGSSAIAVALSRLLEDNPSLPLILDPVLAAGGGSTLANAALVKTIGEILLPRTTVLTPNSPEARKLAPEAGTDLEACGQSLSRRNRAFVLITGTHEESGDVANHLFHNGRCMEIFRWERLPHSYHGSGCTLASAIAAFMAHGAVPADAIAKAQHFTWQSLSAGFTAGRGQKIPNRFYETRHR